MITPALAVLGAVLGIINTWHSLDQRRMRLRVTPAFATPTGADLPLLYSIEVANLSTFAVTICEVGFLLGHQRLAILAPKLIDGGQFPRRLEAREALTAYFDTGDLLGVGRPIGDAYARSATGETRHGSSPSLRQLRQLLAQHDRAKR